MAFHYVFMFLALVLVPESMSSAYPFNRTDLEAAINDMRSKSYFGFTILLRMLNNTSEPNQDLTFLVPSDPELSGSSSISIDTLDEFVLSHSIRMPLSFDNLSRFPTGTVVPSGSKDKFLRIRNHGRSSFFINNAQIVTPNLCPDSVIKCHGIDTVIVFPNIPRNRKATEDSVSNAMAPPPMEAPSPEA